MSATTVTPASLKPRKRRALKIFLWVVGALALICVALTTTVYFIARSSLPQVDGTITVSGLAAPVEVIRDAQGVPHIRAQSLPDLLFAQGYVIAQDRLWQLDITRRYAAGDTAQILGPGLIEHDRQQRILGLRQVAQHSASHLEGREKTLFEAYARGVNAYIESHRDRLPLEFRLLGYEPKPWTVEDSFLIGAQMAQNLSHDQFETKLLREKLTAILGAQKAADLYPNSSWRDRPPAEAAKKEAEPVKKNPDDEDDSSSETNITGVGQEHLFWRSADAPRLPSAERKWSSSNFFGTAEAVPLRKIESSPALPHQNSSENALRQHRQSKHSRGPSTRAFALAQDDRTNFLAADEDENALAPGSNNWVVSGAHTVTGKPLLSNDMHLHHQVPGVWYEAQLTAGEFDVAGVTLPGFPFVVVGHNQRIAWGFTNLGPDVEDIFIENFNAQGEYQTPAGWKQPEHRSEVIHVKGQGDISLDVVSTRHGPVVTELMPGERRKIALRWTLHDLNLDIPFDDLNQAQNWDEFRHAVGRLKIPGQNVVYADVDGHIGYQSTGAIPLRRSGNGALPVSGADDAHEWTGYIPYDQMPSVYDTPSGILATANGRITPDRYPYSISTDWGSPYRTQRIYSVLESGNKFSPSDMLALQTDIDSEFDKFCADHFVAAIDHSKAVSSRTREAAEIMRSWDGRMTADSAAATITLKSESKLKALLLGAYVEDYSWYESSVAWENLLTKRPKYWLPAGFGNYDQLLTAAVEQAITETDAPRRLASWEKGWAYPLEFQHPIFGKIPLLRWFSGPGRVKQSGDGWTVKQVGRAFGPSERLTVDFGDLDRSTLNIVTGESGQIFSSQYMDQWKAWYEGQTFTLPFSQAAVEKAGVHRLRLEPK